MNSKEIIKYLKNSIDEKGNYCYSLPIETTKATIKCIEEKDKEIERLNNIINNANKVLQNILVINNSEHKGKYRPIKNTSKNDVYKSVCMLYGILGTPYRCDYGSLQEFKRADVMNEETINGIIRYNKRAAKEIERLNNIINELEKWLEDYHNNTGLGEYETGIDDGICDTLKKLQKLKGDSSNE